MERTVPLISHESPLCILNESKRYNDYDYILVHLLELHEEYLNFCLQSRKEGRMSIMDTSIFELGKAFDHAKYAGWITKLKPTEYILPDVLEDYKGTIKGSMRFKETYDLKGIQIGVVQGKTFEELKNCYLELDRDLNVDKIAFSFDYHFFTEYFSHPNKWVSFMIGRVRLINEFMNLNIINKQKPHHLLGCSNPLEFSFYKHPDYNFIKTIDTSSPVVHGLKRVLYNENIGDWVKESTKLANLIGTSVSFEQMQDIIYNVTKFRKYVH